MKKFLALSLIGSSLLLGSNPTKADYIIPEGTTWGENSTVDDTVSGTTHTLDTALNCEENSEYGYTDEGAFALLCIREVIKHQKNIGKSISTTAAMNTALSTLPTSSTDAKYTCGIGTGGNSGTFAVSTGCSSNLSDRLSFNAGASIALEGSKDSGSGMIDNYGVKAGFLYKFGPIKKSTLISLNEKKELKAEVKNLKSINEELKELIAMQNQRLERLEKVALRDLNSKDLAVYKLK